MAKYSMFVFTNPAEGREEEFLNWYQTEHIPDMCRMPGVESCQLFKVSENQYNIGDPSVLPGKYFNHVVLKTEDVSAFLMDCYHRRLSGENRWTDAIQEPTFNFMFEQVTERITHE